MLPDGFVCKIYNSFSLSVISKKLNERSVMLQNQNHFIYKFRFVKPFFLYFRKHHLKPFSALLRKMHELGDAEVFVHKLLQLWHLTEHLSGSSFFLNCGVQYNYRAFTLFHIFPYPEHHQSLKAGPEKFSVFCWYGSDFRQLPQPAECGRLADPVFYGKYPHTIIICTESDFLRSVPFLCSLLFPVT